MNSPTLNGETEARSPVTTTKTAGSAALELSAENDEHTKGSMNFMVTSVSGKLAPNEIACLQSACRRSLQRCNFIKLRISAQKLQRAHLARKLRPAMISSTISASSTKQHKCTVRKVGKSTDIESKGVADVKVGVADVSVVHVGTLPCIVVCMTDDTSSSSASRDLSSPVCIALFDGSSCSYSKRRNCVRFDISFYKSLETNLKCVEIMSVVDTSFRLYIDLGSVSKNMQFTRDFLQRSRLPLPVCSVSWWSSKSVDDTSTLYDCLARAFSVTGKCSLLPNKEKLLKSTESPSEDCCSTGRLSRCFFFTLFLLFSFFTPVNASDSFSRPPDRLKPHIFMTFNSSLEHVSLRMFASMRTMQDYFLELSTAVRKRTAKEHYI